MALTLKVGGGAENEMVGVRLDHGQLWTSEDIVTKMEISRLPGTLPSMSFQHVHLFSSMCYLGKYGGGGAQEIIFECGCGGRGIDILLVPEILLYPKRFNCKETSVSGPSPVGVLPCGLAGIPLGSTLWRLCLWLVTGLCGFPPWEAGTSQTGRINFSLTHALSLSARTK